MKQTVIVAFQVESERLSDAERVVTERLDSFRLLGQNDSTDITRGTLDPIDTYTVVPLAELLIEAL